MLTITSYTVELVKDPFGILSGKRYEFFLDIEVPEDDELYQENGLSLRVIYSVEESGGRIVKYEILESGSGKYLDFELETDEAEQINAFCLEHFSEAEE